MSSATRSTLQIFLCQIMTFAVLKTSDVPFGIITLQLIDVSLWRCPDRIEDRVPLIMLPACAMPVIYIVFVVRRQGETRQSREKWVLSIVFLQKYQFCTVPPCHNMASELLLHAFCTGYHWRGSWPLPILTSQRVWQCNQVIFSSPMACDKTKIANLHGAILVDRTIGRFQVSVKNGR